MGFPGGAVVKNLPASARGCSSEVEHMLHVYKALDSPLSSSICVFWASLVGHMVNNLECGSPGFSPWVGKIPWRRAWQPTPIFLPGESPWTEEPDGLQSMRSQRVGHHWAAKHSTTVQEMQAMWVGSLGWEGPLQEKMATHSSIFAWEITWTEEPGW